jgi:hypothetical protein
MSSTAKLEVGEGPSKEGRGRIRREGWRVSDKGREAAGKRSGAVGGGEQSGC